MTQRKPDRPTSGDVVPFVQPQAPRGHSPAMMELTFSQIERIATAIARGGLFGSNNLDAVLTLCMVAHAEGQHPAVVFRDYNIIQGRPAKTAEAMHRDFLRAGGTVDWKENSDEACIAVFSHPRGGTAEIKWDLDRARKAGLGKRSSRNPNEPSAWEKYPRQLLRSRTVSEGCRTVWPAATGGFYEPGEIFDIVEQESGDRRIPVEELTDEQRLENAQSYAQRVLAAVAAAGSAEELDTIQARSRTTVKRLAHGFPDIYQQIMKAYEARAHQLQGFPADEGTSGDTVVDFERQIRKCETIIDLRRIEEGWRAVRDSQPEAKQEEIDQMFMDAYGNLGGGQ